jgi:hypothetical protein
MPTQGCPGLRAGLPDLDWSFHIGFCFSHLCSDSMVLHGYLSFLLGMSLGEILYVLSGGTTGVQEWRPWQESAVLSRGPEAER